MPLTQSQSAHLFAALESCGWTWREGSIYAPHRSIWLGSVPWGGGLSDFHERMRGRLQRIEEHWADYDGPQSHRNTVEDSRSLVDVLAAMSAQE